MNENLSKLNKEELDALLGISEGGEAQPEEKNGDIEARIEELEREKRKLEREKQELEEEKRKKMKKLEALKGKGTKEETEMAEGKEQGIEFGYEVGDKVQWVINGALQWEGGKIIEKIEEDPTSGKKFAFVEGISTGIPLEQLTLYIEPTEKVEEGVLVKEESTEKEIQNLIDLLENTKITDDDAEFKIQKIQNLIGKLGTTHDDLKSKTQEFVEEFKKEREKYVAAKEEAEDAVMEEFNQLGINKEDLRSMENFKSLSIGQQLLVCENLKQLTLGRIQEEARQRFHENISKSGFLGRIWKNITKNIQITQAEKNTAKEIQAGGIQIHGEILKQLVDGMKNFGPEVEIKDNNLEIQYVSLTDFENLTDEQKIQVNNFNKIATEYSKMPYEWSLETADKNKQKKYKETEEKYEEFKRDILNLKEQQSSNQDACLYFNDIERKIKINQFLNTHPDVEEQLKKIEDENAWISVFKSAFKGALTGQGIWFSAGFAARTITASFVGLSAVPIVAGIFGSVIARRRAIETLKEKELLSRKGVKDTGKEAKNFINADESVEKLDLLIKKINSEDDPEKKQKLVNSLLERIVFTEYKINQGLVNFGDKNERLKNQYDIISKLSEANINFETNNNPSQIIKKKIKKENILQEEEKIALQRSEELELRLNRFLDFKEQKISRERQNYLLKKMLMGGTISAASAFAGIVIRHLAAEWWTGEQIEKLELTGEAKKEIRSIFGFAIDPKEGKLLTDLNELLKDIPQDQRGKIALGLIQDGKLNSKDLELITNLRGALSNLGFKSNEQQGEMLVMLTEKGINIGDLVRLENLENQLNVSGITDDASQKEFILKHLGVLERPFAVADILKSNLSEELTKIADEKIVELDKFFDKIDLSDGKIDQEEMWYLWQTGRGHNEAAEKARELLRLLDIKDHEGFGKQLTETLATIHKGEGVEHTLIRQLESNPEKFGCPEEISGKGPDAIREWAGGEAHRIAIKEEYVKVLPDGSVQETRVYYDPKEETQYILQNDKSVQEVKTEGMEYTYTQPTEEEEYVPEPGTPPESEEYVPEPGTPPKGQEYVPEPGTPPGQEYVPEPGTPPGGQEEYVPEPGTRTDQGEEYVPEPGTKPDQEEYVPEPGTEPGATTGSETTEGVAAPEAAHGTGTTGMEQGAGTETGQLAEGHLTPAQIDANLTQQVENIGQNIEKQTTGFWGSLFGGKGRWDYYKEQNVNDFNEWWRAKNEADSLALKNLQNPNSKIFEERGDEGGFKKRLAIQIFGIGNRHLAEEDKYLTVFEYMKKLLKK